MDKRNRNPKKLKENVQDLDLDTEAQWLCALAREKESIGDYEGARTALSGIWQGVGQRPKLGDLQPRIQAEVLLRVGSLAGWLGSARQIPGAQAFAKDLISESVRGFEELGESEKISEAQTDLAICYWREGAMDEARVWFREALSLAAEPQNKLRVLVNSTIVEVSENKLASGLALLDEAAPLLRQVEDHAAQGRYHMQRALVLKRMGGTENLDLALIDDTAASFHFAQAKHKRYFARVENNIGSIYLELGRYGEALRHLDKARQSFLELRDVGSVAQVNETRARVLLAQGWYSDAEKAAAAAVSNLEKGGEQSLLTEALVTQGIARARMGQPQAALSKLKLAGEIADIAGNPSLSVRTFLTAIIELQYSLTASELEELYVEADMRMGRSPDHATVEQLRASIRILLAKKAATGSEVGSPLTGCSMEEQMLRYEADLISRALEETHGSVTRAARILGLTHQGLSYIINNRHRSLLTARTPVRVRRKSIIKR